MNLRDPLFFFCGPGSFPVVPTHSWPKCFLGMIRESATFAAWQGNEFWHRVVLKTEAAKKECQVIKFSIKNECMNKQMNKRRNSSLLV